MNEEEKKKLFKLSEHIGFIVGTYCSDEETEIFEKLLTDYKYKNELIEKQQKEIDKLKNKNKDLLRKLRNRVKQVKKLEKYALYKKEFSRLNKELEKKNKTIDLMAEYIESKKILVDKYCYALTKETIKQYFEKKADEK